MAEQRIRDVDALRGFALLGIFIVNITFMASAYPGNLVTDPAHSGALDEAVRAAVELLVGMKFYLLFSFLFGYSFTLQMSAATRAGAEFVPRMLRRIAGLFAIGVLHTVLLYGGDVLTTYAVACLILLWLRNVRDRTAIRVAGWIYAVVLASIVATGLLVDTSSFLPDADQARTTAAEQTQAMLGGWGDVIGEHLSGLSLLVLQALTTQGPTALAMFLLGMVAGRRGLLARVRGDEPVLRRMQWIGFPLGLAGGLVYALGGGPSTPLVSAAGIASAPLLSAAYVATLLRLMHRPRTAWLRGALAPAGRIALTNYLAQSLIGLLVFTGIGLGAAGSVGPAGLLALAVAIFCAQLALSALWLRRYRYGPAEWALRWITLARRPALRHPATARV
ncbi:uncharacterized protein BJY24_006212 [Nocardia transvalensis]|uniref:DUF418 domain-containing protein n=1 Tax=Nocardia transvalensis TaxID=37333 RepID=A0A7W9PJJ9_9NOCA|nr:DUF418 domain-containing protein [Nocardia transvalensis]MBB5917300.1 uncharacterized protein [Nocardia transvalensis]